MNLSTRLKQLVELLVALILPLSATFYIAQSNYDEQPSAEGRLGQYQNGVTPLYPGDSNLYPIYPGDNPPMYPGDGKWDSRYSSGLNVRTTALATEGTSLFASMEDINFARDDLHLMRFDGTRFLPVGWELNAAPQAIAASGDDIYVGAGNLTSAGGIPVHYVAHLNGTQTDNMGGGLSGQYINISKMVPYGSGVCVSGQFTGAGSQSANGLACWDGAEWSTLAGGVNGSVYAMVALGANLYVGGYFNLAGGTPVNSIAYWDGSTWHALGSGIQDTVFALGFWQGNLYVGTGTNAASPLMRWNGVQWDAINCPDGLAYNIEDLVSGPDGLYVSGFFKGVRTSAYAYPMNYIARWDGANWHNLGSGIDGATYVFNSTYYLNAVQPFGSKVFVGGQFLNAGNNTASGLATWNLLPEVETYPDNGTPIGPGSFAYLSGRYFDAQDTVDVFVNGFDLHTQLVADSDGKVFVHLWFPGYSPEGEYTVTLSSSSGSATTKVLIQAGAHSFTTNYPGKVVIMPFTGSNFIHRLPMLVR